MIVGVPKEIKTDEYRVAMIPVGVEELTRKGHRVLIQSGAGQGSGISDEAYASNGAEILPDLSAIWKRADLIVKVKEPLCEEWPLLRAGQIVFTYFHFAADEKLTRAVMKSGITAIAYETIKDARGNLPLLTPMSEVAGRMSIQEGAKFLERPFEGRGILLGGVPGRAAGQRRHPRRRRRRRQRRQGRGRPRRQRHHPRRQSRPAALPRRRDAAERDHAVQRPPQHPRQSRAGRPADRRGPHPGARAPCLVRREDLKRMPPRAVIIDVAIDQGGCIETSRPTTHSQPTYIVDDVVHYCVTNMPGAVGRTSTYALTQRDAAVRAAAGQEGPGQGDVRECRPRRRSEYPRGTGDKFRSCGDLRPEVRRAPVTEWLSLLWKRVGVG